MFKRLKNSKLVIMLALLVVFVLFDLVLENTSIADRAIAVGMAVDKAEDGQMEISIEFAIASSSSGNGGSSSSNYAVVSQKGETVNEIIDKMSDKMGLLVSLAHVSVLIVGRDVAEEGDFSFLQYLLRGNMLTDTAYIVTTEEKGADILNAEAPTSGVSAFHLQKLFSSPTRGINGVTIKDFAARAIEKGGANFLPYVQKVKTEPDSEEKDKEGEFYFLKADTTAVLNDEGMQFVLNESQSAGLSYVKKRLEYGNIDFVNEKNERISTQIVSSSGKMDFSLEEMRGEITVDLALRVKEKTNGNQPLSKKLTQEELILLSGEIRQSVMDCYLVCAQKGIDLFSIGSEMLKRYAKDWEDCAGGDYLNKMSISVRVNPTFR